TRERFVGAGYVQFTITPDEGLNNRNEELLAEELRCLIIQAVKRRLVSDVPLGIFLSGGIDSSTVLAAAISILEADTVETFTIGFTEPSFDESGYARAIASEFGTNHHEEVLDLSNAQALVPEVLGRLDEPLGDASLLPMFMLCRFARKQVSVALAGDGADELFAGYDPFKALGPAQLYARLVPRQLHDGFCRLAEFLPRSDLNMSFDFKLRRSLAG